MRSRLHLKVPATAVAGEVIRIKTKLNHPMESGWRQRPEGGTVPKALAGEVVCLFNGREVFRADLESGTASDPYLSFYLRVEESGLVQVMWTGDEGSRFAKESRIEVES